MQTMTLCEPETTTTATPALADAVEHEARSYRERGTPLGFEAWEQDVREQYEARGYEAGRAAGRSECLCHRDPLD
jgi:hypothetical protein